MADAIDVGIPFRHRHPAAAKAAYALIRGDDPVTCCCACNFRKRNFDPRDQTETGQACRTSRERMIARVKEYLRSYEHQYYVRPWCAAPGPTLLTVFWIVNVASVRQTRCSLVGSR